MMSFGVVSRIPVIAVLSFVPVIYNITSSSDCSSSIRSDSRVTTMCFCHLHGMKLRLSCHMLSSSNLRNVVISSVAMPSYG